MRSSSQGGPEWIYKKKVEVDTSTQLDQTLTKPFYASRNGYRSSSQLNPPQEHLNLGPSYSKKPTDSNFNEKERLAQLLSTNHFTKSIPLQHNCRQILADFKQTQIHQEIDLLNKEHERLRRLLTQRLFK